MHFIIAACENMIDGRGMLPSDVLTASNGKTVEASRRLRSPPPVAAAVKLFILVHVPEIWD